MMGEITKLKYDITKLNNEIQSNIDNVLGFPIIG